MAKQIKSKKKEKGIGEVICTIVGVSSVIGFVIGFIKTTPLTEENFGDFIMTSFLIAACCTPLSILFLWGKVKKVYNMEKAKSKCYTLVYDRAEGHKQNQKYLQNFKTIEDAKTVAKALCYDTDIEKVHLFEDNVRIHTWSSPFLKMKSPSDDDLKMYEAKCFVPESVFEWCSLVKVHGELDWIEGGKWTKIFEMSEKEQIADGSNKYVRSTLGPVMVYEYQIIKEYFCRLVIQRRIWTDKEGNEVMSDHKIPLFGFIRQYKEGEEPEEELVISSASSSAHVEHTSDRKTESSARDLTTNDVYADENYNFKSTNLADQIERESWLYELDQSTSDDPWDSDNEDDW